MNETAPHDIGVPRGLAVRCTADARGTVLELAGELDLESAPELDRRLRELEAANPVLLLIDLSRLEFMDSSGLAVIVRAGRAARTNGHRLSLRRGTAQVQRLFELTGVLERFTFVD
ncbi:MAG TPA: STAS domain-containing protein [Solirubrobacteraceae bacterium]